MSRGRSVLSTLGCFFFKYNFIFVFVYVLAAWGHLARRAFPSLQRARAALHCGAQASHSSAFCCRAAALGCVGSNSCGSRLRSYGARAACGIFPDKGLNPCPVHWQVDPYPLCHQGSPQHLKKPHFKEPVLTTMQSGVAGWGACVLSVS